MVSFLIIVLSKHNSEFRSFSRNAGTFPPRLKSSIRAVTANKAPLCVVKRISRLDIISVLQTEMRHAVSHSVKVNTPYLKCTNTHKGPFSRIHE